jgi:hypothetical protein
VFFLWSNSLKSGLGLIIVEVSRSHTHSLKHAHTHKHTRTRTQNPLNDEFVYIVCVDSSIPNTCLHPGSDLTRSSNGQRLKTFLKATLFRNMWSAQDKGECRWKLLFQGRTVCNLIDACYCLAGNCSNHLHG